MKGYTRKFLLTLNAEAGLSALHSLESVLDLQQFARGGKSRQGEGISRFTHSRFRLEGKRLGALSE